MPKYSATGQDTGTASTTIIYIANPATNPSRMKLSEFAVGSDATPADQASELAIRRVNDEHASPGGTAVTPQPLDEDDRAALSNAVSGPANEPTYETGELYQLALNQRATFRWVAQPGWEFVCTAAEDTGFGLFVTGTTSAYNINSTFIYEE